MATKIPIDWTIVDNLLQAGCFGTEIAAYLGICVDTLYDRCVTDRQQNWTTYSRVQDEHGRAQLRKSQFDLAIGGHYGMQVWLGKQRLNQYDRAALAISNTADIDPKKYTTEELQFLLKNPDLNVLQSKIDNQSFIKGSAK